MALQEARDIRCRDVDRVKFWDRPSLVGLASDSRTFRDVNVSALSFGSNVELVQSNASLIVHNPSLIVSDGDPSQGVDKLNYDRLVGTRFKAERSIKHASEVEVLPN